MEGGEGPGDVEGGGIEKVEAELDEGAFPFEEKAIKVHEKNMELLHAGVFNAWTEKSLSRLTELMPGRYAKSEMSSGFIGAIDRYVYRSPLSQASTQTASNAGTTPTNADTTPSNVGTTPTNGGSTPSKPDQTAPSNPEQTAPSNPEQT